ncbi:MAG: gliding motility-associated-like protein, partial [Saprospiraceae bacterium]
GCDSVIITMISFLESDTTFLFESSCNPVDTGLIVIFKNNQNGCDSIIYLEINLLQSDTVAIFLESCNPQDTGMVINIYTNQYGCDSLEIISTTLLASNITEIAQSTCDPNQVGETIDVFQNQYGCDSTIITLTTLSAVDETFFTSYTCDPEEIVSDTSWYINAMGCDSLVVNEVLLKMIDVQISLSAVSCFDEQDGIIYIDAVIGGIGPFLYSLDDDPFTQFNSFHNLLAGVYTVSAMDSEGCESSREVLLRNPPEFTINLGDNIILALGDSVSVEPESTLPLQDFVWAPTYNFTCDSCLYQLLKPTTTTTFQLTATSENGCMATDELIISVKKDRNVFVPTVFSPNKDGNNDHFKIYTDNSAESIQTFKIFNRWGALLYEENNVAPKLMEGWDGSYKGEELNPGVFIYFAELKYIDGRVEVTNGDVTLLR